MWNLTGSPFDLTGRVAVVTGGSRGLGAVMARGLAKAGAAVAVVSRKSEACETVARQIEQEGGRAMPVAADVLNPESIAAMVAQVAERFGPVDILVNNAGISPFRAPVDSTRISGWQKVIDTNLTGALLCSQAVAGTMKERRHGKVINITSASGKLTTPGLGAYCVSKAGLIQLTRQQAVEWGPYNIQVNAIGPGFMDVGVSEQIQGVSDFIDWARERTPMGRFGTAEELVGAVVFLSSGASSYLTGQTLFIDGGMLA